MHVNGAINILRHRGASETPSKAYIKLFRMVRTTMVRPAELLSSVFRFLTAV